MDKTDGRVHARKEKPKMTTDQIAAEAARWAVLIAFIIGIILGFGFGFAAALP